MTLTKEQIQAVAIRVVRQHGSLLVNALRYHGERTDGGGYGGGNLVALCEIFAKELMALLSIQEDKESGAGRVCADAKSDMTPCVIKDGDCARDDNGECVGCGKLVVSPPPPAHRWVPVEPFLARLRSINSDIRSLKSISAEQRDKGHLAGGSNNRDERSQEQTGVEGSK